MEQTGDDLAGPPGPHAEKDASSATSSGATARIGLWLGPAIAFAAALALPPFPADAVDPALGPRTAGVALWMAVWWLTEAVPIQATALLPLAVFPVVGVGTLPETARPYAHELIFLFLGGFLLALATQRTGLHRRFALIVLRMVGDRPEALVAGFMGVAAALSMWLSNTATAVMMLPVATSVLAIAEERRPASWRAEHARHFGLAMLLGVAYAASIGGVATPVGTPPNLFLISYLSAQHGIEISFVRWMTIGLPLVGVMLPLCWWLLVRRLHPFPNDPLEGSRETIARDLTALGSLKPAERTVLVTFLCVCLAWLGRPWLAKIAWDGSRPLADLSDAGIAIIGALVLFCAGDGRGGRVLDWEAAKDLPWGILILFGGGLSLADGIARNGVDDWIGSGGAALAGWPALAIVLVVVAAMVFLTELTSNTASTAALVPVLAAAAPGLGLAPLLLAVPAALAASFAFMLPVATPPNAVVFGSGRIASAEMRRAGLWLNWIGIAAIVGLTFGVVRPLLLD